jgi:hypothetical protein
MNVNDQVAQTKEMCLEIDIRHTEQRGHSLQVRHTVQNQSGLPSILNTPWRRHPHSGTSRCRAEGALKRPNQLLRLLD